MSRSMHRAFAFLAAMPLLAASCLNDGRNCDDQIPAPGNYAIADPPEGLLDMTVSVTGDSMRIEFTDDTGARHSIEYRVDRAATGI